MNYLLKTGKREQNKGPSRWQAVALPTQLRFQSQTIINSHLESPPYFPLLMIRNRPMKTMNMLHITPEVMRFIHHTFFLALLDQTQYCFRSYGLFSQMPLPCQLNWKMYMREQMVQMNWINVS